MAERQRRLTAALKAGAGVAEIQRLVVGVDEGSKWEIAEARAAVRAAMDREEDVLQVVLAVMGKKVLLSGRQWFESKKERSGLYHALGTGRKEMVLAVVERMKRESAHERSVWPLSALFNSQLFMDEEVVEAVLGVMHTASLVNAPPEHGDLFIKAMTCRLQEHRERAVDLCIRLGLSMEGRLREKKRFCYVHCAATRCSVTVVQKMHDMLPLLPNGSGKRGTTWDYARTFFYVGHNRESGISTAAIMQFLTEQYGSQLPHLCRPRLLLHFRKVEGLEWLLWQAPELLVAACRDKTYLARVLSNKKDKADYLIEQMVELVEPSVIVNMVRCLRKPSVGAKNDNWRMRLKKLHEGVPECMNGLRWQWLMSAIRSKAYGDVEYMLGMCRREHLALRNQKGDRAYDVAARDEKFPPHLLCRLKVVTKGAQA